ncbi:hypothetical protein BRC83_07930 [Halobacteriales archaeon QS_1_68_17]|nr:MAG: hypothetical protein BRC83_07930 [Halobacteriales archaeon QS_1_68_17]
MTPTTRGLAALGLLAVLVGLAGCSTILGPGEPNQERLNEPAEYDWETDATASINVSRSSYTAVYRINGSTMQVYRTDGLGTENPLSLTGLKFRYPNGTVVNASALEVSKTRKRTVLEFPTEEGQVAFTAPRQGKTFATPVFVTGTYEVTLPPGARVGVPLLSQVRPGGYRTDVQNDRMTIRWNEVETNSLSVRYYLARDLWLFGGLVALAFVVGAGGVAYYVRQIRELERRREEVGLDVDTEDDDLGGGPPPGMR